jgi:hypothetical protein
MQHLIYCEIGIIHVLQAVSLYKLPEKLVVEDWERYKSYNYRKNTSRKSTFRAKLIVSKNLDPATKSFRS